MLANPGLQQSELNMSNRKDTGDVTSDSSIMFADEGVQVSLRFESDDQAIWATGQNIAELFGIDYSNAKKHIKNVYADQELVKSATMAKFAIVQIEGGREVVRPETAHYNLDMIISVGYRVNARRAVRFRQWATQTLKTYIEQGYVINEKALRESPDKLNKLAAAVRALRSEEKQVYAKVRECFRICASDYDPNSKEVRSFYALLQDKFHHAVTGMTSSKLILDRANHLSDNMGMQAVKGANPTIEEAKIGKNYLNNEELYRLHLLSEQFMLYAESTALTKRPMTMSSLHGKLDALLIFNDYPVFSGYEDYIKEEALSHARLELGLYKKRLKIESLGYKYDEDALAAGEYDELLIDA
ncbi:RhuM family protein [Pseudomonas coronafaciens]|uniref:RhuM family protein n=1 Tax=Pseudomonas coronafaciens TaxID=53409 RepID=UPI001F378777|nr:RhuM family protein [Pseudomonas coronafaciens]